MSRLIAVISLFLVGVAWSQGADIARQREFHFSLEGSITGVKPGDMVRVWLPVPPSNDDQVVTLVGKALPATEIISREAKYANQVLYFETAGDAKGTVAFSIEYRVRRREVVADLEGKKPVSREEAALFLKPDARVPVGGKPLTLLAGVQLPMDQVKLGRALYDVVNSHMRYSKEGSGWGQGDAEWACDSKYGNCSDFHSLFISLARSQKMPAKFEIGFPLPEKPGSGEVAGYHCWAKFRPEGRGWVPVDISEANKNPKLIDYYFGHLSADRIAMSVGRDLELVPKQAGPPLNFFVYPYAEIDGKPVPSTSITRKYTYRDIPANSKP